MLKLHFTVRLLFKIPEFCIQIVKFYEQDLVFVRQVVRMQIMKLLAFVFNTLSCVYLTMYRCAYSLSNLLV